MLRMWDRLRLLQKVFHLLAKLRFIGPLLNVLCCIFAEFKQKKCLLTNFALSDFQSMSSREFVR